MIAGFLQPTEGVLEVLGYAPTQVDELRSRIGVLPQDALLPGERQGRRVPRAHGAAPGHPAPIASRRRRARSSPRSTASDWWNAALRAASRTVWRSALQLAQALLGDPEVVLLDEPTAGLDPRVAYEVRQLIKRARGAARSSSRATTSRSSRRSATRAASSIAAASSRAGSITELTASSEEVRIKLGPPARRPIALVRELPMVKRVEYDEERRELVVYFERGAEVDAETVIGACSGCSSRTRRASAASPRAGASSSA